VRLPRYCYLAPMLMGRCWPVVCWVQRRSMTWCGSSSRRMPATSAASWASLSGQCNTLVRRCQSRGKADTPKLCFSEPTPLATSLYFP